LLFLREDRLQTRDFAPQRAQLAWLFELPALLLNSEMKDLLA
jgi:hypothetical protein